MSMMDNSMWLEKVLVKVDLSEFYKLLHSYLTSSGNRAFLANQHSREYSFPITIDDYKEKTVVCHPWLTVAEYLPPMLPTAEVAMISSLLEGLNSTFMWNLDITTVMTRELWAANLSGPNTSSIPAVIVGRSNAERLGTAFRDMGMPAINIEFNGIMVNSVTVDAFLPAFSQLLEGSDSNIPVVLYILDGACFRSVNADGDLLAISRNKVDRKFHIVGDLAVTPYSLLTNVMSEMERIISACGKRRVYIMAVLPRYVLNSCCDNELHCTNVRNNDDRSRSEKRGCWTSWLI